MSRYPAPCPLLIAHCLGMRLIVIVHTKADPRLAALAFVLVLLGMLAGCAGLPGGVQRTASQARIDVADTRLAAIAAASIAGDDPRFSGMRLLPAGDQAFEARIALARAAEKSIDAQYFQIADDASGRQFLRALSDAAARGVRVRLLVDDLHATGEDRLLAGLAARPNVEVRMFNPLPVRDGSVATRVLFSLHEFSRINRRMHNKLFVADNVFAISGGRNIADAYFDRSSAPVNFIDMDMLAAGPVVQALSTMFDGYWNSELAYPIQSLAESAPSTDAVRQQFDDHVGQLGIDDLAVVARDALGQAPVGAQLASGRLELHMAAVRPMADAPGKAAGGAPLAEGAVMAGKLALMQSARSEVLVASPYFVPGRRTLEILRQATDSRVRVSVVTNSLATTDEPLAHFGYARYRGALVQMGVSLYELMPGGDAAFAAQGETRSSLGRLHAKVAVIDQRWLYVGSLNMDPRSAHCNTEMGLIVDSPVLAGQAASLLQGERLPRSYLVRTLDDHPGLRWIAQGGDDLVMLSAEPSSSWGLRFRMSVLSLFVNEELL